MYLAYRNNLLLWPAVFLGLLNFTNPAYARGLPCGTTPGNNWLAQDKSNHNSDPINLIICFKNVSWNETFKALSQLPGRSFQRHWPLPPVKGPWRQIYAPVKYPLFQGNHCINPVKAKYGSTAWREQTFSARENGCGSVLWSGVNHFRLWGTRGSTALAASTEKPCGTFKNKHCIVDYNYGRDLLASQLEQAARKIGVTLASGLYDTGKHGSIKQPDGSTVSYDGKVRFIALTR